MYGDIKQYKLLLIIPMALLVLSAVLFLSIKEVKKDIDLSGGTQITALTTKDVNTRVIENLLKEYEVKVRIARGFEKNTLFIQYAKNVEPEEIVSKLRKYGYEIADYSIQKISPALAKEFYAQMIGAMLIAFIFMSIVVFVIFREILPSFYVLFAVASDIFETFVFSQYLGIPLSIPSIAAFLLLIGYSVDTDILLTTRVLKGEGELGEKLKGAFKTGMTMSLTTIVAVSVVFLISSSSVLKQISAILLLGIWLDMINTWFANGVMLRWWIERKK